MMKTAVHQTPAPEQQNELGLELEPQAQTAEPAIQLLPPGLLSPKASQSPRLDLLPPDMRSPPFEESSSSESVAAAAAVQLDTVAESSAESDGTVPMKRERSVAAGDAEAAISPHSHHVSLGAAVQTVLGAQRLANWGRARIQTSANNTVVDHSLLERTQTKPSKAATGPRQKEVPAHLIDEINAGNCVAFVGAGFSAAAKLPDWHNLLEQLVQAGVDGGKVDEKRAADLRSLIAEGNSNALDRCAQLLEDFMGQKKVADVIAGALKIPAALPQQMIERLQMLVQIPFSAILTTNFDPLLPGVPATSAESTDVMRRILREPPLSLTQQLTRQSKEMEKIHTRDFTASATDKELRPTIQLHGSIDEQYRGSQLAFTRLGYRNLLHGSATYAKFLSAVMATKTVLYIGFSFSDEYVNELRSSTVMLTGADSDHPIGYAVVMDKSDSEVDFFRRHEGTHMLRFSKQNEGFEGLDLWLQAISMATNPVLRWARGLVGKKILWCTTSTQDDAEPARIANLIREETSKVGDEALVELPPAHIIGDEGNVQLVRWTIGRLQHGEKFDLLITRYGDGQSIELLDAIGDDAKVPSQFRCPVMVVDGSTDAMTDVQLRKREVFNHGASKYSCRYETILRDIFDVLAPAEETI